MTYLKLISNQPHTEKRFSRPNKIRLNFLASDLFKPKSNFLRTEKEFSRPNKIRLNFPASDIFKTIANLI